MSHTRGIVLVRGKVVGHFEYSGTGDRAFGTIGTEEEIREGWRTDANDRRCECRERVEATADFKADYGDGVAWRGSICMSCMTILATEPGSFLAA